MDLGSGIGVVRFAVRAQRVTREVGQSSVVSFSGVPITVTLVSVAVVAEWLSPIHVCVIGTLARGPLSVVAGTRTPVSSTLDRASGGSLLCGPHGRTHELNVFANRAIGFLVTYSHNI